MEGDLREFALAEILQFVSLGSRTGVLEVLRRDGVYRIAFTSGGITGLSADGWSVDQELRLSGMLPPDVVSGLLAADAKPEDLRSAVLTGGYMSADEWNAFVARQVERLLYTLFDAKEGKFRFRQAVNHAGPWLAVRISADRAVLEGTRWSETWNRAMTRIPTRLTRIERTGQAPVQPVGVSPTQWRVFVATSEPGTVLQIATRAILSEAEVIESLQFLLDQGIVCVAAA
jgi:hypothetical protein